MSLCSAFSPAPGGSTFDPTNPGPIGGTTPDVGNFTRLNVSPTWNNAGTDFTGIYGRVTNTASGASSKLLDLGTVGGGSKMALGKYGDLVLDADSGFTSDLWECKVGGVKQAWLTYYGEMNGIYVRGIGYVKTDGWMVIGGLNQVYLGQQGNGKLLIAGYLSTDPLYEVCLGVAHATTATPVTIKAHNVTTGTGADLVLKGGTGSVNGGMVKLSNSSNDVRLSVGDDGVGFFSAAPKPQATTFSGGGSHAAGSGTGVTDDSTFDGYTIGQIVAGLRSFGLFA